MSSAGYPTPLVRWEAPQLNDDDLARIRDLLREYHTTSPSAPRGNALIADDIIAQAGDALLADLAFYQMRAIYERGRADLEAVRASALSALLHQALHALGQVLPEPAMAELMAQVDGLDQRVAQALVDLNERRARTEDGTP